MDFALSQDICMVRDTVARFVQREVLPLEPLVLRFASEREFSDFARPSSCPPVALRTIAMGTFSAEPKTPAPSAGRAVHKRGAIDQQTEEKSI